MYYEVTGCLKHVEMDDYNEGCQSETEQTVFLNWYETVDSVDAAINSAMAFLRNVRQEKRVPECL